MIMASYILDFGVKVQANKPAVKIAAAKKNQPRHSGLRISFKPGDLGRTTDKAMAAQVIDCHHRCVDLSVSVCYH